MQTAYLFAIAISGVLATGAVLVCFFDDNIIQRVGLSLIGFSSFVEMYLTFKEIGCCQLGNARNLFVIGCAIYACGTAIKVFKHNRMKKTL